MDYNKDNDVFINAQNQQIETLSKRKPHALYCDDPSLTQQQFEHDSNINNIMKKYRETGILGDPSIPTTRHPQFGDFSNSMDYLTAQLHVANVNAHFEQLPAEIRAKFLNNPALYLDYMGNTDISVIKESIELGLRPKDYLADTVSPDSLLDVKGLTDTNSND